MEDRRRFLEIKTVGEALRFAGSVFYPHFCLACHVEGKIMCEICLTKTAAPLQGVFFYPGAPLDEVIAMGNYGDPILRTLLQEYKYDGITEAGEVLERCFSRFLERHRTVFSVLLKDTVIVPVPLHPVRQALRGFNQMDVFAARLAREFGCVCATDLLRKNFRWRAQANIDATADRRKNAAGSISLVPGAKMPNRIILIDDVFTTGATLSACAAALRNAGAKYVSAVTLLKG